MVLSLLLPGLGQAYQGRLWRALIWFGGTVLIAVVVGRGGDDTTLALSMGTAIAVASAPGHPGRGPRGVPLPERPLRGDGPGVH